MKTYIRKLIIKLEAFSYPTTNWWTKEEKELPVVKRKSRNSTAMHSPDSYNVRGKWGKKPEDPRYNPAP